MSAVEGLKRGPLEWRSPAPAQVELHLSSQPARRLPLHGPAMRLGRDPGLELCLDHPAVSKQHARLEAVGRHWLIRDSGSTNGLFWRGQRIRELLLRDGDVLRFGPPDQPALPELVFQRQPEPLGPRLARGLTLLLAGLGAGGALILALASLWTPVRGSLAPVRGPLALYDRLNRPLSSAESSEHRENDALSDFPPVLVEALLASEDSRFWWHPGVDPIGTARALATNVLGGRVLEGGSTLTQQLARSLYPDQVGQGETLMRKWRELLVALQLEARFSKGDLLLSYLNRVYLGVGWGFEDAARHYFAKPAAQLSLEEAALLVGLLPSPNGHDPCLNPQAALEARNVVLLKMADSGRVSADQARRSRRSPIQLGSQACRSGSQRPVPFYTDQVRLDLERLLGADVAAEGNFLVETHLDPAVQAVVERELRRRLAASAALGVNEGAVVLLDSRSGGVIAIAGGRDYRTSQYNRASQAQRQPGSTFKLFTYLAALQRGARSGDPISCSPLSWGGQSFSSGCGGSLSLRQAFAISSNTAALRLARRVGLEAVVQQAQDLGISSSLSPVPGLTLGQSEVRLIELTAAYAAVANGGIWHAPSTIRRLTDAETCTGLESERCRQLRNKGDQPNRAIQAGRSVLKPEVARSMQGMLQAVVRSGTGHAAYLGGEEGGKTGTTNGARDLLFIGSEPSRHWVMGIWLGNDDNSPTRSSSALAAGLWGDIMRQATPSRGVSSSGPPAANR
ncbi:transglycosylase domain-containing protein [Synechococcus sp. RedBA-s]|uniref:transglycosylase domain-containing protein n=1 Tax=Synechococcus sp. RedBA-s TaxID=2823741 RepID=UPI0020CE9556|nr:transglycosylase domain-containing protein [Synechococcus sp. RedBA-s]MCP9800501.1 transglycosylase domain-containing protein [Synechococcus sp. RedBA-s]